MLELLQLGDIDLLPDVAFTDNRNQALDFHNTPALYSWSQLYSSEGLQLKSILDLNDMRIAVLKGSVQQDYLQNLLDSFGLKAQLIGVPSLTRGFKLVASGGADAVVANQQFGDFHAPSFQLQRSAIMFQPAQLFYATRKGHNAELLAAIDKHLLRWQSSPSSVYYQSLKRWSGERPRLFTPTSVWWGLAIMALLLTAALAGALLLRRQRSSLLAGCPRPDASQAGRRCHVVHDRHRRRRREVRAAHRREHASLGKVLEQAVDGRQARPRPVPRPSCR